jgi:glycosyltransferase involved in cell wall biosynthesis
VSAYPHHSSAHDPAPAARTRVLFVIHGLGRAGPELNLLDFALRFPENTDMHVCTIDADNLTLLPELRKTRANVAVVPVKRAYADWRQIAKVVSSIDEKQIAIVNSFGLKTLLVCLAAKLRYGRRIRAVHNVVDLWDDLRHWHQRAIMWRAMQWVDVIVCNGHAVRDAVIGSRAVAPRVIIIPGGVDCEHFRSSPELRIAERRRQGFSREDFVLGTVANVRPVKNYPFLLRTMQRIALAYPHARLLCVGGGQQLDEMRRLAERMGLDTKVRFTGPKDDIRPYIAAMDAFALCSLSEGCPNALLQAMAMSVPAIASAVGEIPYLLEHGAAGLLFDPTDEDGFFASVSRLVEDETYRRTLGQAGRQRVEDKYALDRMVDQYVRLFDELVGELHPQVA